MNKRILKRAEQDLKKANKHRRKKNINFRRN